MEEMFGRAVVMGCACVITSRLTCEQYEKYRRYHPEALQLTDEDGRVVFSVDLDDGPGRIEQDKAVFSRTKTPDGRATITVLIDPEVEDKAGIVRERFGAALLHLDDLEAHLLEKLPGLEEEERRVDEMISRIG